MKYSCVLFQTADKTARSLLCPFFSLKVTKKNEIAFYRSFNQNVFFSEDEKFKNSFLNYLFRLFDFLFFDLKFCCCYVGMNEKMSIYALNISINDIPVNAIFSP